MISQPIGKLLCFSILLASANSAVSAEITYNEEMRPVLFTNLDVNGETYHVRVEWNSNYPAVYGGRTPHFWGSNDAATAAHAMRQALLDDGYVAIGQPSYLRVPNYNNSNYFSGPAVFLHNEALDVSKATINYGSTLNTVGCTRFSLFYDSFEE